MQPQLVATSSAVLATGGDLARQPRAPWRSHGQAFDEGFDRYTLFHDCFRAADGKTVLLIGPPLRNLQRAVQQGSFRVAGSPASLNPRVHSSLSVSIVALDGVPPDATELSLELGAQRFALAIQPNYVERLAGRRVLFTMNRNNSPEWICAWADYHRRFHGVDSVIVFDNGSTNLDPAELANVLTRSGVPEVLVVPWKHPFGPHDPKVLFNRYWARFAQIAAMNLVLRRFGAAASGLLNCDIDELVHSRDRGTIFDVLEGTAGGLLVMHGVWIETNPVDARFVDHRAFGYRMKAPRLRHCAQRKWVLDPRRAWVSNLDVHPYMHWIEGRPRGAKSMPPDAFYWHFKGINTNWKMARNKPGGPEAAMIELDPELATLMAKWRAAESAPA